MNAALEQSGFVKLTRNKYLAGVAGFSDNGRLELPSRVYDMLDDGEGYVMERARIALPDDETLGQFSGKLTELAAADNLSWGTYVPGIDELARQRHRLSQVCITFADDDTPVSLEAAGFKKVDDGSGFATFRDFLNG